MDKIKNHPAMKILHKTQAFIVKIKQHIVTKINVTYTF